MNTTQLECFLAVAETLNFSKAAAAVNISQPAVSHQIASLEDELGVRLFLRTKKSVQLTNEGASFIADAENILRIASTSVRRFNESKDTTEQVLKIGCHNQFELNAMIPVLRECAKHYPNIQPEINIYPFKSMSNMLSENKIQLMFSLKSLNEPMKTDSFVPLCDCPIVLVCCEDSALAGRRSIDVSDISGRLAIVKRQKCPDVIVDCYVKLGAYQNFNVLLADGFEAATALTKAGLSCTISPLLPMMKEAGLRYIPINGFEAVQFGIYYKNLISGEIAHEFVNAAKRIFKIADFFTAE